MDSLTEHLLSTHPNAHARATQHPFLRAAGLHKLSSQALAAWLTQDRLYALCGYSKFLGTLIARCPAPVRGPAHDESRRHLRRLEVLAGAMANIAREVKFFEETAEQNHLDLQTQAADSRTGRFGLAHETDDEALLGLVSPLTRGYIDYQLSVASGASWEEGLVLLWAMEKLYLDAWRYAATFVRTTSTSPGVSGALSVLIPNWSSPEFATFVDDIAQLVDELPESDARYWPGSEAPVARALRDVYTTCLWYEGRFWDAAGQIPHEWLELPELAREEMHE